MRKLIGLMALSALALGGCGDDDSGVVDAGGDVLIMFDTGDDPVDTGTRPDVPRADTGGTCGDFGAACTPDRGCARSTYCQDPLAGEIGGAADPITNQPPGTSLATSTFPGGYCTPDDFSGASLNICDADDPDDPTCGSCGECLNFGQDSVCLLSCAPSATDNDICRDGYACLLGADVCLGGCVADPMEIECRSHRRDTNGIPGIQTRFDCDPMFTDGDPANCGGDMSNFDELVYDTESTAVCNQDTYRCDEPGTAGAEAGDTCLYDDDCEADGRCLDESRFEWPGGYCSKDGCSVAGIDCAGDGVCEGRGLSTDGTFTLCLEPCTITVADDEMPATWLGDTGGCREGYQCFWNGRGGEGVEGNGFCLPGDFNEVTEENVGEPCEDTDECWSPFGRGRCFTPNTDDAGVFRDGYCTVSDCAAPGAPDNLCGEGNSCVTLGTDFDACVVSCTEGDDCRSGYGCIDLDGMPGGEAICFPGCGADADCPGAETCDIPAGETQGICRP